MNDNELISICIPAFNDISCIEQVMQSALKQTYQNFEIIIIDDQSTDGTYEILKQFKDPRIKLSQNKNNLGWRLNSNKILSLAEGKYVTILHSDDLFKNNNLEIIKEIFDTHYNVGIIHSINEVLKEKFFDNKTIINSEEYYSIISTCRCVPAPTTTAYRNKAIQESKYYDKHYWTGEVRLLREIASRSYDAYIYGEELCIRNVGSPNDSNRLENKLIHVDNLLDFYEECKFDAKIQEPHKDQLKKTIISIFNRFKKLKLENPENDLVYEAYNKSKQRLIFEGLYSED